MIWFSPAVWGIAASTVSQSEDLVEYLISHLPLGHKRKFDLGSASCQDRGYVRVRVETGTLFCNVVCHNKIERFVLQLRTGVFDHVHGFGRKSHYEHAVATFTRNLGQDIGGLCEFKGHRIMALLFDL